MPQSEAARRIGISRTHLSNIEVGRARPGWSRLMAMATVYDVAIDTLIREVSVPGDDPATLERPPRRRVERPKKQPAEGGQTVALEGRITAQSSLRGSVNTTIVGAAFSPWEIYVIEGLAKLPAQEKRAIFAELMEKIRATLET